MSAFDRPVTAETLGAVDHQQTTDTPMTNKPAKFDCGRGRVLHIHTEMYLGSILGQK